MDKKRRSCTESACKYCSKIFMARNDSIKKGMGKYCSKSCQVKQQHADGTNKAARKDKDHHNWVGGRIIDNNGYFRIRTKDGEYELEHRTIMSEFIGREIERHEVVHHIDEDRLNNSISNLELMTRAAHTSLHHLGKKKSNPLLL